MLCVEGVLLPHVRLQTNRVGSVTHRCETVYSDTFSVVVLSSPCSVSYVTPSVSSRPNENECQLFHCVIVYIQSGLENSLDFKELIGQNQGQNE